MEKPKEEKQTQPHETPEPKDLEKLETHDHANNTSKPKDLDDQKKLLQPKTTKPRGLDHQIEKQPMKFATSIIPKELETLAAELEATVPLKTSKPKESVLILEKKEMINAQPKPTTSTTRRVVWDCESSLYDSFELKSFEKQLDSAIISSSRTLSMPHLSDHHRKPPLPPLPAYTFHHHDQTPMSSKKPSKLSRSIHKFLRSVFRPKQNKNNTFTTNSSGSSSSSWFRVEKGSRDGVYYVYDTSGALTTIPEGPETVGDFDGLSPDLKSFVRRTASDRFAPTSIGISCA